jgi:hypothetical protein
VDTAPTPVAAGVGVADTSAGGPWAQPSPDTSAAATLLASLSMLRSVREESGSLDARPNSGVLLLATNDCLDVVLRSSEIDESEAGDIKLVSVPKYF